MRKKAFSVIGKPLPKVDGLAKCTGDTRYADDLDLPRMAYAKLLRSPIPHARVRSVRTDRAAKLPTVRPSSGERTRGFKIATAGVRQNALRNNRPRVLSSARRPRVCHAPAPMAARERGGVCYGRQKKRYSPCAPAAVSAPACRISRSSRS